MQKITDFLYENLQTVDEDRLAELEARNRAARLLEETDDNGDPTIKNEDDFRAAAEAKFEAVFGDELDRDKMNDTIDGILKDHSDLVENGEWSKLIGILNQSFAS